METCTDSGQAGNQLHGASPYVDPDYEFNAPRFYDFQRLKDNLGSPVSEGDTYFDTSKVKGESIAKSTARERQHCQFTNAKVCAGVCRRTCRPCMHLSATWGILCRAAHTKEKLRRRGERGHSTAAEGHSEGQRGSGPVRGGGHQPNALSLWCCWLGSIPAWTFRSA